MNIFKKHWKTWVALTLSAALLYGIRQTLQANIANQQAQAHEAQKTPLASVQTIETSWQDTQHPLTLTGTLRPYQTAEVLSEAEGKITGLFFDLNQPIAEGQLLAQIDAQIKETHLQMAELNYQKAKKDFERFDALHQNNNLPTADLDQARYQLQAAENQLKLQQQILEYVAIKSPIAGIITKKMAVKGKVLQVGSPVATITDISQFRLEVAVAAQDLDKVSIGTMVQIAVPSLGLTQLQGLIKAVGAESNEAGSFPVEILVPNAASKRLLAGMQAEVTFKQTASRQALLIPRMAVADGQVWVVKQQKAYPRKVTTGKIYDNQIEITSGLQAQEWVIVKGQQNVSEGQPVQTVNPSSAH